MSISQILKPAVYSWFMLQKIAMDIAGGAAAPVPPQQASGRPLLPMSVTSCPYETKPCNLSLAHV